MDSISQTTFSNAFSWMKIYELRLYFTEVVLTGSVNNIPALVQIMAWCRPGDKPLSGLMTVNLLMHICIIQPQWVKHKIHQFDIMYMVLCCQKYTANISKQSEGLGYIVTKVWFIIIISSIFSIKIWWTNPLDRIAYACLVFFCQYGGYNNNDDAYIDHHLLMWNLMFTIIFSVYQNY